MLKLTWIEFFLRSLPEIFILIWGIHVISKKSFNIPKYIISSIAVAILTFFTRWLPISFGIHMIINIILTILAMVIIGISVIKSIYSTLLLIFMLCLSEFLNMMILSSLNINIISLDPFIKCLYGTPSLIFLSLFIIIAKYVLKMKDSRKELKNI